MSATDLDLTPVPDYGDLSPRVGDTCVVLGAGHGIGRQCAHAFAQAGHRVVCVDVDPERARRVAHEVGGEHEVADLTRREEVDALVARLDDRLASTAAVVDVVGAAAFGRIDGLTDAAWERQSAIVLDHGRIVLSDLVPRLPDGATVTFVSSTVGLGGGQEFGAYAAAKAALISLVRTAAVEYGPRGIRVNTVAPGVVATPRMLELLGPRVVDFERNSPLGRLGLPAEVARAALFLGTSASEFVSGHVLVVDGGVAGRFPYPPFIDPRATARPHVEDRPPAVVPTSLEPARRTPTESGVR